MSTAAIVGRQTEDYRIRVALSPADVCRYRNRTVAELGLRVRFQQTVGVHLASLRAGAAACLDDRAVFGADGRVARLGGNFKRQHLDVIESLTPRTKEDLNPSRYFPSAFDEGAKPLQMASIDLPRRLDFDRPVFGLPLHAAKFCG